MLNAVLFACAIYNLHVPILSPVHLTHVQIGEKTSQLQQDSVFEEHIQPSQSKCRSLPHHSLNREFKRRKGSGGEAEGSSRVVLDISDIFVQLKY